MPPSEKVFIEAGERFGRLTVISGPRTARVVNGRKRRVYLCSCDCGIQREIIKWSLIGGRSESCGCLHKEKTARIGKFNATHGESGSKEHRTWKGIIGRCCNPKNNSYIRYGGVGIKMCDQWRNSYSNFLGDVGRSPSLNHSLDRYPNQAGNYEPGNVRWATRKEQDINRKSTIMVTISGVSKCVSDWAKEFGIPRSVAYLRIKRGWGHERALTQPCKQLKNHAMTAWKGGESLCLTN